MARHRTIGFEAQGFSSAADTGGFEGSGGGSVQSSVARSGSNAWAMDSGAGNSAGNFHVDLATTEYTTSANTLFGRVYFRVSALPSSNLIITAWTNVSNTGQVHVRLTTAGKLQLLDRLQSQVGSDSAATIATDTWYRLELKIGWTSSGVTANGVELLLDGTSVASGTGNQNSLPARFVHGWPAGPGANKIIYGDDIAINDASGSAQNSYPGSGKILFAKAISDNQRGSWTGGAGGTSNLFEAVNNTPPIGTASETDSTQIENADTTPDNSTDEYRVNMTTYTNVGLVASDTITLVQAVVDHGEDIATGTKTGSLAFQSNPTQSGVDTFTFGEDIGALGTWPSNWRTKWGTAQYSPSVTLGNSPVLALRKTDTGSRVASADFLGAYVEYVPAPAGGLKQRMTLLGVDW